MNVSETATRGEKIRQLSLLVDAACLSWHSIKHMHILETPE